MTNEEARAKFLFENCSECGSAIHGACNNEDCEIYIAIKALEMQIPKKPIEIESPLVKWGKCPNCKGELQILFGGPNHVIDGQMFCSDCGQALDWSEKHENDV